MMQTAAVSSYPDGGEMMQKIQLLDCTLRDGAYITGGKFGVPAVKGLIKKLAEANIDIIECGWLKNAAYEEGTSYFHVPDDLKAYIGEKKPDTTYVVMIDWDRYDLDALPDYDGSTIDAVRVVFPHGKVREGTAVGAEIKKKGYKVYLQLANTLAYSDDDLIEAAGYINALHPVCVSVVDTFGAMYEEDLERILKILHKAVDTDIMLGFHSHNNQQLAFALSKHFVDVLKDSGRDIVLDGSLCGMGRGAGNATTELVASFLDRRHNGRYDMNVIMDSIDLYMEYFKENYSWGYSTKYMIAGMYCCHVNNIAYLTENHRTGARDMKNIIESLSPEERTKYDYDLLEEKYITNQSRHVDDEETIEALKRIVHGKKVLLIAPGRTSVDCMDEIKRAAADKDTIVIAVNAVISGYDYDYLFFTNEVRYTYARDIYTDTFSGTKKIILSNIRTDDPDVMTVNFDRVINRGGPSHRWPHFDNAMISALRFMSMIGAKNILIAGFDGFKTRYNESYGDENLPTLNPENKWDELNEEIMDMFGVYLGTLGRDIDIKFITPSIFAENAGLL